MRSHGMPCGGVGRKEGERDHPSTDTGAKKTRANARLFSPSPAGRHRRPAAQALCRPRLRKTGGGMGGGRRVCVGVEATEKGAVSLASPPALSLPASSLSPPARRPASTRARARPTTWASPWCGVEEGENARKDRKERGKRDVRAKKPARPLLAPPTHKPHAKQVLQQTTEKKERDTPNATYTHSFFLSASGSSLHSHTPLASPSSAAAAAVAPSTAGTMYSRAGWAASNDTMTTMVAARPAT